MPVRIKLDGLLHARKMTAKDLAQRIGVSETHLSQFRSGKVRGIRFSTLSRLCSALSCEPGDLLGYEPGDADLLADDDGDLRPLS